MCNRTPGKCRSMSPKLFDMPLSEKVQVLTPFFPGSKEHILAYACEGLICVDCYLHHVQACSSEGESGRLPRVMAAFARPTRIVRGKEVDAGWIIDESRFVNAVSAWYLPSVVSHVQWARRHAVLVFPACLGATCAT